MKKSIYRFITTFLMVGWMVVIFHFSAQPATESSEISGGFCGQLINAVNDRFELKMSEADILQLSEKIEFPVRKMAHMAEYAVLGLFCYLFSKGFFVSHEKCTGVSFVLVFLYAAGDELHQRFVPGRSGQFSDVLIDTLGGICMLLLLHLARKWYLHKYKKNKEAKKRN